MLTYTPLDSHNPAPTPARLLHGNPLEGALGPVNVGETERFASIIGGAALIVTGLSRRSLPGLLLAALGGLFITRGVGGHCKLYDSVGISTDLPHHPDHSGHRIEKSILIARPPQDLYRFWRNLENLPEFMQNIESIRILDDRRSHWIVKGPAGRRVEWDAEIVNEHPGEMISWQTLPGADVHSAGTVRFNRVDDPHSTLLRVVLEFRPPGGELGTFVSRFLGKDPTAQLGSDLERLKQIIESHDIPTIHG